MYQTLVDAMRTLAEAGAIFGLESSRHGEQEFQIALGRRLERMTGSDGWTWRYGNENEEQYETGTLVNKGRIEIDLVGRHDEKGMVAIELKYVPVSLNRRVPNDPPAFPYDLAKDCLRLDLLRAGHCMPAGRLSSYAVPDRLQTYAIGMTNWPDYWLASKPKLGWASHFFDAIRPPVRFEGLIKTKGANPENTIALKRCHIAFGRSWTGEWHSYIEPFRYLILRPESDLEPRWTHDQLPADEQSATVPFLNTDARDGWRQRARKMGHAYE
ncbi:hypothetical protein ACQR1Y_19300 [Bradyrhizobium sp. HKCCYLRH3099]|uniref:hypothetical protein n=1 Tax=unclassified Bradyrhizobium TaxID=2631580 RepID=UPI003EBC5E31